MSKTNLLGKTILGYTICERIESGTFGTVYKAVKKNITGEYIRALKHIHIPTEKQYNSVLNSMGGDASKADNYFLHMLENIVSEIQILNDLSEKGARHIVRYYENDIEVTELPRSYDIYILMEYLTPLEEYIQECDVFTVKQVMNLAVDILKGVAFCHKNRIIHRDIKDENIFVSANGEFKIGDFGVSKVLKDSSRAESLKGTPNFLAPEVYLGKAGYTKSVDLYSLGMVIYRLLNYGRNPFLPKFPEIYFPKDEDFAFEKRMRGEVPELPSLGGEAIGNIVVKAISPNETRYQNANEFYKDLVRAQQQTPDSILENNIKLTPVYNDSLNTNTVGNLENYNETLAATYNEEVLPENDAWEQMKPINRNLFESIADNNFHLDIGFNPDGEHSFNSSQHKGLKVVDIRQQHENAENINQTEGASLTQPLENPFEEKLLEIEKSNLETKTILQILNTAKTNRETARLNAVINSVHKLDLMLANETDFGFGNSNIIKCENDIARDLLDLKRISLNLNDIDKADLKKIYQIISHIHCLLEVRKKLEKKVRS